VSARSRTPRGSVARDDGQATVEFALLLPVLVLAAVAIIQVGLVVRDFVSVVHAAREAARAPIEVEVEYRSVTDLPLVGALFPDPLLHHSTVMRVER
jgi:Flp pilus assembly protein TadG